MVSRITQFLLRMSLFDNIDRNDISFSQSQVVTLFNFTVAKRVYPRTELHVYPGYYYFITNLENFG